MDYGSPTAAHDELRTACCLMGGMAPIRSHEPAPREFFPAANGAFWANALALLRIGT